MSESPAEDAALLIDYLNGQLPERDAAAFKKRLETDLELRASLAVIEAVRAADSRASTLFAPSAFGWNRLKQAIAKEPGPRQWYRKTVPGWQAAAASIAVGFAGWQLAALDGQQNSAREAAGYTPAGSLSDSSAQIKVAFTQDAQHSAVSALVRSVDGQIVAGPSALGFYTIEFETAQDRGAALVRFADAKAVVSEIYSD